MKKKIYTEDDLILFFNEKTRILLNRFETLAVENDKLKREVASYRNKVYISSTIDRTKVSLN